jgi:hypothetical protein
MGVKGIIHAGQPSVKWGRNNHGYNSFRHI